MTIIDFAQNSFGKPCVIPDVCMLMALQQCHRNGLTLCLYSFNVLKTANNYAGNL